MQQNPHQSRELLQRLRGFLNHPAVKTAIGTSIVALSVGSGFVDCLNKNDTEINACLGKRAPLAIGLGFVGAVFSAVIFKCIRECNQSAQTQEENPNSSFEPAQAQVGIPNSSFAPPFGFGNINRVVPDRRLDGHY